MNIRLLGALAAGIVLAACSGISTTYDYSPDFSFGQAQTWDWMPRPPIRRGSTRAESQFIDERLRAAIELTMEEKGFVRDESDPDLRVGFHLALDEEVSYQTMNNYYGSAWGYGMYRYPYGGPGMVTTTTTQRRYTVGTLIIDIFDTGEQELVWRGTGEGEVHRARDPQERQRRADEAVWEVMRYFPPES